MKLIYLFVAVAIAACSGSSNSARPCDQDSECNLGEVCSSGSCTSGCRSARDCPPDKAICDLTAGSDGACVECVAEADCGDGRTCVKGTCRKTCERDADCPGERCDVDAKICVQCIDSGDCALGNLCIEQTCKPGCERDRDCPDETPKCDPDEGDHGTCFECLTTAQCGASQKCGDDHRCHDICTSNAQCTVGVCDIPNEVCVDCLDKAHCPLGEICFAKQCIMGCEEDRDCPDATPNCDPNAGSNGTCYECTTNADCGANGMCMNNQCSGETSAMVDIPAGSFVMGFGADAAENRRHTVTLSAFSIDTHEVTNARYKNCVDDGACSPPSVTTEYADPAKAQFPVAYVTWQKAATFCAWAGKRLPTEAEWERAARGTDERSYPWGTTALTCALTNAGVGGAGGQDPCVNALTAVGTHTGTSAAGVHDMAGNAREWVSDWYAAYPPGNATDPQGPGNGTDKIARGGSYVSVAADLTTYVRPIRAPSSADSFIGFRCAKGGISPAFTVTPGSGTTSTSFAVDASGSSDAAYPSSQLQVRWDWTNDGTFDTSFTTTKTASHVFAAAGFHTIRLEVKNPANATRTITRTVTVTGAGGGTQGAPCSAPSHCNANYVCLSTGTCAEMCAAGGICTVPNTTCQPTFDITGNFTAACQ